MAPDDKAKGMKSAYELALERLAAQGLDDPGARALTDEQKRAIADARALTKSKLAELEILHRDKMAKLSDPVKRDEQEEFYRLEKERLESDGEKRVAKIRSA
jgi:hypothetical protein